MSTKSLEIHDNSAAVLARDMYSASVDDLSIVGYFLALQLIIELPKKAQKPLVDHLSKGHHAQSASENA